MASAAYPSFLEGLLGGTFNLTTNAIAVALLDNTYVYSAAHDFRNDLTGVVALTANLTGKTIVDGVFDAADGVATSVSGNPIVAIAIYRNVGTAATDDLLVFIDGLNLTPNGNNINVVWNASGIFAL